ncbi:hypothetical protein P7D52_00055 [Enterococcus dongliensis]|uniref:hypothetical protein n=1 Tax=Enterococcus dongliensis TaxID=2559925 RepID=UPI00288D89F7|nr:hypothetical protein [Enterococcus dongliensis]MDT2641204.1 hypothetical protein [Enterococcus dongliensis]
MDDIVPALLESIQSQFDERTYNSAKLKKSLQALKSNKATYIDVNDFAIEIGEILADVLGTNITAEVLPDGKMYFNIADRILNLTLKKNHELISGFAVDVQKLLNDEANLHLKSQTPEFNQDRVDGLVNKLSSANSFEDAKWLLDDPIINFSQSIVDDVIAINIDFHANAGLEPTLTRKMRGDACNWCKNLAGTYEYYDAPDDIYRRHERCRCTVEYDPKDGRRVQNAHTKKWREQKQKEKIAVRKTLNLRKRDKNES